MPNVTQHSLEPSPDIFTIICCNDSFQLALDHSTIKTLLRFCRRARPLLSSKLAYFHTWCQKAGLCHPDGQLRIGLTLSDQIAISLYCEDQETTDRYWLEDQADQGCSAAAYFLARILQVELAGQPKISWPERRKAQMEIFHLFKAAAEADHTMAKFHLADCYRNGLGVNQGLAKAIDLYRSLAERGIAQAQIALGHCYENGEGVEQDFDSAIEWYSKAADQGSHGDSQFWIGESYRSRRGGSEGEQKAFEWFSKSADQGNLYGQWRVGWCYSIGCGVTEDRTKAIEWFRKSAEQGNRYGQHWLGYCYHGGRGVPENIDTAVFWYRKSADQGYNYAINNLKQLGKWP
ncbi:uncharacterized protein BJ171DRAFT_456505 [Polychytrium aggregatum]|uniref:uncharacterized protein n=1 Tax=Polychytrium aggregatum TaxID=110093 RepID=UPI0022FF0515|nr:uncharacterized protein BJ171DRAFT_456505 [Polychytrium aggregatum]KAI9207276.1 hypothetical protein BJ171DRAFT_456505 [Polychytrium aggregatum]